MINPTQGHTPVAYREVVADQTTEAKPEDTHGVYERQGARFDAVRSRSLIERSWLERFAATLPAGGRVLDVGCGGGEPIAKWFIEQGFQLTGVDFSSALLELARDRWPDGDWRHADMRTLELGERFDGIIAWNSFFHLTAAEQAESVARFAEHLTPGGSLMMTVGPDAGEAFGTVGAEPIYHASLSPAGYATLLEDHGLRLTEFRAEDATCAGHSILMARKITHG